MKVAQILSEITTPITPDKFTPARVRAPGEAKFDLGDEQEKIGKGLFARAFSTKTEPGTVRKVTDPMTEENFKRDAYFRYIKTIANKDRFTANPYFPKIYDIQVKTFPDDRTSRGDDMVAYAVDMERLHEYRTLSVDEIKMLGEKMFYDFEKHLKQYLEEWATKDAFMWLLRDTFKQPRKTALTIIRDPKLKEAILFIRDVQLKGTDIFYDIHAGNVMVRRGPGGPQLVFTDPVAH